MSEAPSDKKLASFEALLFIHGEPLSYKKIESVLGLKKGEAEVLAAGFRKHLEEAGRGLQLISVALFSIKRFGDGLGNARLPRAGEIVQDDFRIASGLEYIPATLQFLAYRRGIHQVAVVSERNLPFVATHLERLGVSQIRITGS